jgi:integrase
LRKTTSLVHFLHVIQLLERIKPHNIDSEFLFPSKMKRGQPRNTQTANMALKRMGYEGRLVAHGLHALASTALNEHEFNPNVIEAALAHTDKNEIRATYNRAQYLKKRRVMMCWWPVEIEEVTQSRREASSKVSNIKGNQHGL